MWYFVMQEHSISFTTHVYQTSAPVLSIPGKCPLALNHIPSILGAVSSVLGTCSVIEIGRIDLWAWCWHAWNVCTCTLYNRL